MDERVAIVSMAYVNYKERVALSVEELLYEAIKKVLDKTGLTFPPAFERGGIDSSISCHEHTRIMKPFSESLQVDVIGGHMRPDDKIDQDGAMGVTEGLWQIMSGEFETVIVTTVCHDSTNRGAERNIENFCFDPFYHRALGLDNIIVAALQAKRYMNKYGIKSEQIAKVAVKNLKNARNNPYALVSGDFTVEDVLASKMLADPITSMESRPFADGAIAMILANEKRAKKLTDKPVWIKGVSSCCEGYFLGDRDLAESDHLVLAAKKAYQRAGIRDPRKEIDVAEVTDEFAYQELMTYEGLGFCGKGEGGKFIDSGITKMDGKLPVNPSGGALSGCAHTNIGMARIFEIVLQLCGEAGARQVPKAKTGLAHFAGGPCGQLQQVMILGSK